MTSLTFLMQVLECRSNHHLARIIYQTGYRLYTSNREYARHLLFPTFHLALVRLAAVAFALELALILSPLLERAGAEIAADLLASLVVFCNLFFRCVEEIDAIYVLMHCFAGANFGVGRDRLADRP